MTIISDKLRAAGLSPEEVRRIQDLSNAPAPAIAAVGINGRDFFFSFPRKNASNSVKWALHEMPGSTFAGNPVYVDVEEVKRSPNVPRVAVVRHPVDRIVSCWRHVVRKLGALHRVGDVMITENLPFAAFVELVANCPDSHPNVNYHFRSQSAELVDDVGGREPDYLLHVETLKWDWEALSEALRWPKVELERINATTKEMVPFPKVTEELLDVISTRYRRDFELFNYHPYWKGAIR